MEEYKKVASMSEKELETLRRKYSVARHQISLLYKDYLEEGNVWKKEKEQLQASIKKLSEQINLDSLKLQEYDVINIKNLFNTPSSHYPLCF